MSGVGPLLIACLVPCVTTAVALRSTAPTTAERSAPFDDVLPDSSRLLSGRAAAAALVARTRDDADVKRRIVCFLWG